MANILHPHYAQGFDRDEPIMVGSSDDENDNIEHRRTRRLGGPQGTPIPRRAPERNLRIFSPAPPPPAVPLHILQALPFLEDISQNELMRLLMADRVNPRFPPFARSRPDPPEPEPYDVTMTHASARPRLGFTFDFEQPEEEEKPQPVRVREPVKYKQTIEIPDSPPLLPQDAKGKGKAIDPDELAHREIIEIYSDDEEPMDSVASSSQSIVPVTKLTSVLICAGCRRPLRTGGDRLWALRCGHMIDSRCYASLSRPQFSSLPLLARLGSPPGPPPKRRKTTKGKGKGVVESHEWTCPVASCNTVHKSERTAGEDEWVPAKDHGAIKVFI